MRPVRNLFFSTVNCVLVLSSASYSQTIESFDDGDLTNNPAWGGETNFWQIVTNSTTAAGAANSMTLQLDHKVVGPDTAYISLQRTDAWGTDQSWGFWVGMNSTNTANSP